jgi:hypothetical protein
MGIKEIVARIKKGSGKTEKKSSVTHSDNAKMKSRRDQRKSDDKDSWANQSGIYSNLSERQKKYLEKVNKILEQEDADSH